MHYSDDVIFNTIVSHKTGDQVYNPQTGDFKVSISNFSKGKSHETEWGLEPSWTPIVQFNGHIIYAGLGMVNDAGFSENSFVAFIREEDGKVHSTNFGRSGAQFAPIFANEEHAYIIVDTGEMIVLDREFNANVFTPYEGVEKRETYYVSDAFLMLDEKRALQVIADHDRSVNVVGTLTLSENPTFTPLEKEYFDRTKVYRILYKDDLKGVIFLVETGGEGSGGHVLVLDNEDFQLIDRFAIEYPHLLDIVLKK